MLAQYYKLFSPEKNVEEYSREKYRGGEYSEKKGEKYRGGEYSEKKREKYRGGELRKKRENYGGGEYSEKKEEWSTPPQRIIERGKSIIIPKLWLPIWMSTAHWDVQKSF